MLNYMYTMLALKQGVWILEIAFIHDVSMHVYVLCVCLSVCVCVSVCPAL